MRSEPITHALLDFDFTNEAGQHIHGQAVFRDPVQATRCRAALSKFYGYETHKVTLKTGPVPRGPVIAYTQYVRKDER